MYVRYIRKRWTYKKLWVIKIKNMRDYFFEIPIYLRSEKKFELELETRIQKKLKEVERYNKYPDFDNLVEHIRSREYRDWEYNQIIGYLKLFRQGSRIYAHIWKIERKRYPFIIDNKIFKFQASYPEWDIDLNKLKTSQSIFEKLLKELPNDMTGFYNKYYLDLRILKKVGPHLDWIELLYENKLLYNPQQKI